MDKISRQREMADALRMLADDIETGCMPMPYSISGAAYWLYDDAGHMSDNPITPADARLSMSLTPGGWNKTQGDSYIYYSKRYGAGVSFEIPIDRETTCKRVQTGVKHVEATEPKIIPGEPEHDEPVYEWVCDDSADAETELAD